MSSFTVTCLRRLGLTVPLPDLLWCLRLPVGFCYPYPAQESTPVLPSPELGLASDQLIRPWRLSGVAAFRTLNLKKLMELTEV